MIDSVSSDRGLPTDLRKPRRKHVSLADPTKIDRLPPHSIEAEQGVLGCLMLSPKDCLPEAIEKFKAGPEVFYDLRHQAIYAAMVGMFEGNAAIDLITLAQWLKDGKVEVRASREQRPTTLEEIGGVAYLSSLPDAVPSAVNLAYYADIVVEKFVLRKLIRTGTEIVARAYEHEGEVDALMDEAERDILAIAQSRVASVDNSMKALVRGACDLIQDAFQNKGALTGIDTGFVDLNKMTNGLQKGDMIVIAARPSLGKTSLAMNIAEHAALESKIPVGVFSLEMTAQSLVMRMLCSNARVNIRDIRDGFMSERDFPKLVAVTGKLSNAPLYIDDTPGLSILQLRAKARRMHQQYGIRLFIIDYLQLMHSTASRARENRQQETADISSGIKALAKELNVPVIVLSQLNREVEKRDGNKPRLSDLRESGAIEQDADFVGLLYKPEGDEDGVESSGEAVPVNLLIAKQRNGPTGDVPLTFLKNFTRFENAAKEMPADI